MNSTKKKMCPCCFQTTDNFYTNPTTMKMKKFCLDCEKTIEAKQRKKKEYINIFDIVSKMDLT